MAVAFPARKCLEPDNPVVVVQRDQWLINPKNGVRCDRAPELPFDLHPPLDTRIHLCFEEANTRSARRLGAIERAIRAPDELVGVRSVIRSNSDANSNAELRRHPVDDKRL